MQKEVKFQTEEFVPDWTSDYSEKKFTVFSTCFLSTKKNSHKLDISEEVLRRDAGSILGNFLVAKIEDGDALGHEPSEQIFGYFPKEQEIIFDDSEEGIVKAKAYCVVSKMYGAEFNEIFSEENLRNTSVEMTVTLGDDEHEVLSLDILGLTCLGADYRGSCPDANMEMVRFSQEAEDFFKEKEPATPTENNQQNGVNMTEPVEDNSVVDENNEQGKEGEQKLAEIEFSVVNIGDLWGSLWNALRKKDEGYDYCIEDIYEENNQKFALIKKYGSDDLYRLDFTFTEEGLTLADEIVKVEIEVINTETVQAFAEPENAEVYKAFNRPEQSGEAQPSVEQLKADIAKLQADIAERDGVIEENKTQLAELSELREYKSTRQKFEQETRVTAVMAEVSPYMDEQTIETVRNEGLACEFSELDGWANKAMASVWEKVPAKKSKTEEDGVTRMSGAQPHREQRSKSALERIKEQYL